VKTAPLIAACITAAIAATVAALALPARAQDPQTHHPGDTPQVESGRAPLAPFAGRRLVVLPVQFLLEGDTLGWSAQIQDPKEYLASFDAELSFALTDRGLKAVWVLSDHLAAEYKRNIDYMADPHHLGADFLRYPGPKRPIEYLPDPLAGQLRSIIAMNDKAEYVLLPVELRFIPGPDGVGGRAALRATILDPRRLKTYWMADVYSDTETSFTPALMTSLAEHLANLFAHP
jgi:hypothetical protein